MRRGIIYLVIFLILLAIPFVVRRLNYYGLDAPQREAPPAYAPVDIPERVPTPPASDFVDEPKLGSGLILLDESHSNDFDLSEISYLDSRLAARGYELVGFQDGNLASALRPVNAFIVIAPMTRFEQEEVQAVSDFVDRGGRLMLVGDPTRFTLAFDEEFGSFDFNIEDDQIALNSLANEFDLVFNGDYLYNTVENEGNFRNIVLAGNGLAENGLTDELQKLAFYGSHSIQVGGEAQSLLSADENTWSSSTDRPGGLSLAALGGDERVLAVGDVDFFSEPYHTVYDNSRFIANIADFLTDSGRGFLLADFPYFFESDVDLVYVDDPELGPDAFDEIIALQEAFGRTNMSLDLVDEPIDGHDTLFLGLYNQAEEVADILESANITLVIDPPIVAEAVETSENGEEGGAAENEEGEEPAEEEEQIRRIESELGNVQMSGTALVLLRETGDSREVVVLASSGEGLDSSVGRLISLIPVNTDDALSDCFLQDNLALCPTGVADEPVEIELDTSGVPDVVGDQVEDGDEDDGADESGDGNGGGSGELEADSQGVIALDESVQGTLEEGQAHSWTFNEGPVAINIILESSEDIDGVLELYDPDGNFMAAADSTFAGEEERLEAIEIPDGGEYTIIVKDFFDDGGDYALTVEELNPDDIGAEDQGELSLDEPVSGLLEEGQSHSWTFVVDGPTSVDIVLQSGPDLDGVLALFGPDETLIQVVDDSLQGEEERLDGLNLTDSGDYSVIVGDFAENGGEYTLIVESAN